MKFPSIITHTAVSAFVLSAAIALLPVNAVSAEDARVPRPPQAGSAEPRPAREARMDAREDVRNIREDAREDRRDILEDRREGRAAIMQNASGTKPEVRALLKENREKGVEAFKENADARKKAVEARRKELKAQLDKLKADRKDEKAKKLDGDAKERVEKKISDIYKRLEERVTKLTKVDTELASRITKIAAAGIDTSAVTPLMTSAQAALSKAKTDVEATKTALAAETGTNTAKETIRALVKTAEDSIRAAGESYKKVMDAVKALPKPARPEQATSTVPQNI